MIRRALAAALLSVVVAVAAGCTSSPAQGAADGALGFYQQVLGRQWAWHCNFQPGCSTFARQAVAQQGAIRGVVMAADRLQRDHAMQREEYPHDEYGRPIDPPAASALFGPRVEEEALAHDAALAQALAEAPPLAQDDAQQAGFADRLWDAREWERARIEYERLLFGRPGSPFTDHCRQRAALCLAKARRRGDALAHVEKIAVAAERERTRALVEREIERPAAALRAAEAGESPLLAGFLALEAERTDVAREQFARVGDAARDELLRCADDVAALPRKSPYLAGTMSALLPGSGQLYVGRPGDALAAFTINAVLIGGTIAAARRDQDTAAIAIGFVASGFWVGNIYGAANGAALDTRERRDHRLDQARGHLRQSGFFATLEPDQRGGAIGLYFGL